MKAVAHVDPGKGQVYRVPCDSLEAGRRMVRGPYLRHCRIVLVAGSKVECYERGNGTLKERRVS